MILRLQIYKNRVILFKLPPGKVALFSSFAKEGKKGIFINLLSYHMCQSLWFYYFFKKLLYLGKGSSNFHRKFWIQLINTTYLVNYKSKWPKKMEQKLSIMYMNQLIKLHYPQLWWQVIFGLHWAYMVIVNI